MDAELLERSPSMAFRQSQRQQQMFLPPSIEEFVAADHPVRAYDAFVDALDWRSLGIEADPHQAGCPAYPPTILLKILVYGYSYGIRSSRKLERALHESVSFIWLAGGLKLDFKTIARFRRDNRKALQQALRDCARLCLKLNVIAGNTLFVDGSKFRANAGNNQSWTAEQCEQHLRQIDQRIEEILHECERVDTQEAQEPSLVHLQEQLAQQRGRQERIATAFQQLQQEDLSRVNITDPDCAQMRGRQGCHAGYNSQIVVDEQHGLIGRYFNEDLRDRLRQQFERPTSRDVYQRHKETAELPFGHIKRNLGAGQFLLRGLAGVGAELSLLASCFNMARLIGLFGMAGLVAKLSVL